jgi:NAD-dependent SIR2 family protein deacetylase
MDDRLKQFVDSHERIFVLTGAGISTGSGIPDYRDRHGAWKHQRPMEFREFVASHAARQRYWTRSWFGWQRFSRAQPNAAHLALARLERLGRLSATVTQNVDGLQQLAGSQRVTELHGSLATVSCLSCGETLARVAMQEALGERNPWLPEQQGELAPDGDAEVHGVDAARLQVPGCNACGGVLKPDVVFFGESIPPQRVQQCRIALGGSDAMLVVGSSLMVFSGFRFVREACQQGIPVAAINRGRTRADELLQHKFDVDCALVLTGLLRGLDPRCAILA